MKYVDQSKNNRTDHRAWRLKLLSVPTKDITQYQVIFADTDAMGVVYHARYLEMAERSRNKVLANAGVSIKTITEFYFLSLVIKKINIDFLHPTYLDDEIEIRSVVLKKQASRVWWRSQISTTDRLCAIVDVATVCIDKRKLTPVPTPGFLSKIIDSLALVNQH